MHARVFQHVPFEGLGSIEDWLGTRDAVVSWTRWYQPCVRPPEPSTCDLLIILGGPMSANDDELLPWLAAERAAIRKAIDRGIPTLGICLGAQLIAKSLGARVFANREREIGWWPVEPVVGAGGPFADLFAEPIDAFHWHGETFDLPSGAEHLGRSAGCEHQAFSHQGHLLALQFHLETTPGSAEELIRHSDDHTLPGRFSQSTRAMLSEPQRFEAANRLMTDLLDRLAKTRTEG
jgi:GMP synthase-like glutamine amidotransferase